jgi:hypothetical protein
LETNKVDNWMARKYKKSKADRDEVRGSRGCNSSSSGNSFEQRHAVAYVIGYASRSVGDEQG